MKTFLSEQHATKRNKDSNDQMVNVFKLTIVYFARPNPLHKKTVENHWITGSVGHRAIGPWAAGLLLAKPQNFRY